jgi:hypothetical protein
MIPEGHAVIVGASGAGKTVTAKVEVERLLGEGRHTCIIDPTGVWHGLRALADGVGAGFPIPIFGGLHGDLPIKWTQGGAVGAIISSGVSAILDVSQMDSTEQQQFVADFIAALRQKPRGNFHLIVDEADEFAPQTSPSSAGEACKRQMEWIAKRGRVQGFVLMAITQRVADIAKSVISQTQTVIVHQLIAPADKNAIRAYLRDNATKVVLDEVLSNLAGLAKGERYIFNPQAERLERGFSPMPKTFDTSRTPLPGEAAAQPQGLAEIDIAAIKAVLVEPESEVDNEQPTGDYSIQLKALRAEVARLTEQRDGLAADIGYGQQQLIFLSQALRQIGKVVEAALAADGMERPNALRIDPIYEIPAQGGGGPQGDEGQTEAADVPPRAKPQSQRREPQGVTAGKTATDLPKAALTMIAMLDRISPARVTWAQLAAMCGYKPGGGNFNSARKAMRESGRVVEDSDTIRSAVAPAEGMTREAARQLWKSVLLTPAPQMLDALTCGPMSRADLAQMLGKTPSGGHWNNGIAQLRRNGLVAERDGVLSLATPLPGERA